jgi:predicted transglutaminase-like cysteine proteinase
VDLVDTQRPPLAEGARPIPPSSRAPAGRLRAGALRAAAALALVALSVQAWDPGRIAASARPYGPAAEAGARALEETMKSVVGQEEAQQLRAVNDFFNRRIRYAEDIDTWGEVDYWASPIETLSKGAGDCEDFAIAKYFTLVALGMPDAKLRMVYVRANIAGSPGGPVPHMVLAYYARPDAEPLVLDNLEPRIEPAGARPDLSPVFSFNADGLWQGVGSIRAAGDPIVRLSHWREVLARARQEGFQ